MLPLFNHESLFDGTALLVYLLSHASSLSEEMVSETIFLLLGYHCMSTQPGFTHRTLQTLSLRAVDIDRPAELGAVIRLVAIDPGRGAVFAKCLDSQGVAR
jgi:hypothetical protein